MKVRGVYLTVAIFLLIFGFFLAYAETNVINLKDYTPVSIKEPLEQNGGIPVNVQDQTTPPLDLFFADAIGVPTTLQQDVFTDNRSLNLTSTTNFTDGTYIGVFQGNLFFLAEQIGAPVGNVIELDTPLDFNFTSGAIVIPLTRNLNVDGSVTPRIFSISGGQQSNFSIDITRIMISFKTDTAVSLAEFGDLPSLTYGLVLRRTDGTTRNIWNVKNNGEIANLCYDYNPFVATNPSQGQDGAIFRYTFSGQDKHGVAVRLTAGERLELIIQDDLTDLNEFRVIAEGHIVQD